jgi:hypothetical protein
MSCAANTTETVRTVSDYCLIAKGLTFSQQKSTDVETTENKYDTNETVKQIIDHDLTYEKLCQAQKPVDK